MELLLPSYAVDNDDILFKSALGLLTYYNSLYGTKHTPEDFTEYNIEKIFRMDYTQWYEFEFQFYASEYHRALQLNDGAKELVQMLRGKAHTHIVTSRPVEGVGFLKELIARNFETNDFKQIHMIKSLTVPQVGREKWQECKRYNLSLLLDDHDRHINLAAQNGIPGILLKQPWNKNKEVHPLVKRAENLYEAAEIIQKHHLNL